MECGQVTLTLVGTSCRFSGFSPLPTAIQKTIPLRFDPGATQYREPVRTGQRYLRNPRGRISAAAAAPQSSALAFFVLWLHFSLDFALISGILIYVDYCAWSAGTCLP